MFLTITIAHPTNEWSSVQSAYGLVWFALVCWIGHVPLFVSGTFGVGGPGLLTQRSPDLRFDDLVEI